MSRIPAKLFGGSAPGSGSECTIAFSDDILLVEGPHRCQVLVHQISVNIGGANDDAMLLHWDAAGVAYSLVIDGRGEQQKLLAHAPAALSPQLRRWRNKAGLQRFKWNALLATLGALALATALVIWQSERVEHWLAAQVPLKTEQRLGESALKQISQGNSLTQQGPAAAAVKQIGDRLTKGSRYPYRWYVKDDDSLNAFALPGGIVIVHTGLLEKTESAEELAGVLAHEVQHLEQRHSLQQMIHSAGWAAVLAVTLGDVSAISAVLIHQAGNMRNSRELESQADLQGLQALIKAGISPLGMASFFKRMAADAMPEIPLLSSHPAPAERLAQIEQAIKQNPCTHCVALPYDWHAVRDGLKTPASAK